jgi:hypothetical protein
MTDQLIMALGCGFVGAIVGVIGINRYKPVYHTKRVGTELVKYAEDHPMRKWSFAGLSASMGLTMAPLFDVVTRIPKGILDPAKFHDCYFTHLRRQCRSFKIL